MRGKLLPPRDFAQERFDDGRTGVYPGTGRQASSFGRMRVAVQGISRIEAIRQEDRELALMIYTGQLADPPANARRPVR